MIFRFIIYGLLGIAIEVIWTAIYDKLFNNEKSWDLKGTTYIWMMPIYGMIVLSYEPVHHLINNWHWFYRGFIYMLGLFAVEYIMGRLLLKLGRCPWNYTNETRFNLHGLIRFDYAPLWFMLGLMLEPVDNFLNEITPLIYSVF